MNRLAELEVFVAIVDNGGFARAARALRISPAMVSTHIMRLEERLGVRLLDRTTRRMDLTQKGRRLLDEARHVLSVLAAAEAALRGGSEAPAGRVRIDAPAALGAKFIVPAITRFRARYPEIVLDLTLGDRGVVFRPDGFDVVVRVGEIGRSKAFVQCLGETRFVHVASPAYLALHPAPATPNDLMQHACIFYAGADQQGDQRWRFARDGEINWQRPPAAVTLNDGDAIGAAAMAGVGIGQTLEMLVAEELAKGDLVRVLDDWDQEAIPFFQMSPRDRCERPAVRAVLNFLAAEIDWSGVGPAASGAAVPGRAAGAKRAARRALEPAV